MDRSFQRALWDSRNPIAGTDRTHRIARLHPSHKLGCLATRWNGRKRDLHKPYGISQYLAPEKPRPARSGLLTQAIFVGPRHSRTSLPRSELASSLPPALGGAHVRLDGLIRVQSGDGKAPLRSEEFVYSRRGPPSRLCDELAPLGLDGGPLRLKDPMIRAKASYEGGGKYNTQKRC